MVVALALAFLAVLLIVVLAKLNSIGHKLDALQRVGVLVTSDKEAGRVIPPMSARQRIRWFERRMNGFQRATP